MRVDNVAIVYAFWPPQHIFSNLPASVGWKLTWIYFLQSSSLTIDPFLLFLNRLILLWSAKKSVLQNSGLWDEELEWNVPMEYKGIDQNISPT